MQTKKGLNEVLFSSPRVKQLRIKRQMCKGHLFKRTNKEKG